MELRKLSMALDPRDNLKALSKIFVD